MLYGEITALTGKEGYCFATNKYFAELYHVTTETISRWISHLNKLGFIKVEILRNKKNEILQRRIFIIDNGNNIFMTGTYCQNNQYPYLQNSQYPIDFKIKDNKINIRIEEFFNFIIKKESKNPEKMTEIQTEEFSKVLEKLEFNYTEELLKMFTKENIEKLKIIIYALKELFTSSKKMLIQKTTRDNLVFLYDNCKKTQQEYQQTSKRINNFFEYYYISLIKELEKVK